MTEFLQFQQSYFEECRELLQETEERLAELESDAGDTEALHAVFRAVHSIKGGGGAFGFERLVSFAHVLENVLDQMRGGRLALSRDGLSTLMQAADVLSDLVLAAMAEKDVPAGAEEAMRAALQALAGDHGGEADGDSLDGFDFVPIPVDGAEPAPAPAPALAGTPAAAASPATRRWQIQLRPHAAMFRRALDPLLLIRELAGLGGLEVTADLSDLPAFEQMEPDGGYINWTLTLTTAAAAQEIAEVFEFVDGDCDLAIQCLDAPSPTVAAGPGGEAEATTAQAGPGEAGGPWSMAAAPVAASAPALAGAGAGDGDPGSSPRSAAAAAAQGDQGDKVRSIRVELGKIDRMVNMVGEMVITQSMLASHVHRLPPEMGGSLLGCLELLMQQMRQLQDIVMTVRASPVKTVFSRMPRLVRELSKTLDKQVRLHLEGEETELDRTVIEQLADPLTHMIRNAMDHGLEGPAERVAAGKPPEGTIILSAAHVSGQILIEIRDDGRGINRERVRAKAIEKGLVNPEQPLTDHEIDNLIFAPGFSTAETVSDLSGRGVGTDVVRRNIEAMGGRVLVRSEPGRGTTFQLTLPLTLAIMDGMILSVGSSDYVIPIANVVESAAPEDLSVREIGPDRHLLHYRGAYIPLASLRDLFGLQGEPVAEEHGDGLIIICDLPGGRRFGLKVDAILGQQQVVVKSLEENFAPVAGVAAATILGDGRVSLILDVPALMQLITQGY